MVPDDDDLSGEHPLPPEDLHEKELPTAVIEGTWDRIHHEADGPIFFNKRPQHRFNATHGQFGALYGGDSFACAVMEKFGTIDGTIPRSRSDLDEFRVTSLEITNPISVVDITGSGLRRIGADGRLTAGSYRISRVWAVALFNHPEKPRGIRYRSRPDQSLVSVVLFDYEDVVASISAGGTEPVLSARHGEIADILRDHGILLPDDRP